MASSDRSPVALTSLRAIFQWSKLALTGTVCRTIIFGELHKDVEVSFERSRKIWELSVRSLFKNRKRVTIQKTYRLVDKTQNSCTLEQETAPLRLCDSVLPPCVFMADAKAKLRSPEMLHIDAVLIDDDLLVHATWIDAADRFGKKLVVFTNVDSFLEIMPLLSRATPIYIDSDLKTEVRGEFAAKAFYSEGFKEIYLVTGYAPETFGALPWIRSILGKRPVWI